MSLKIDAERLTTLAAVWDLVLAMSDGGLSRDKHRCEEEMVEVAERCALLGLTTGPQIAFADHLARSILAQIEAHVANPDPMARAALEVAQPASSAVN